MIVALIARSTTARTDRKSTRLNSSHSQISYAVFCLKKKSVGRVAVHPQIVVVPRARRVDSAKEHHHLARAVVDEVVALSLGRAHRRSHLGPGVRGETIRPRVTRGRPAVSRTDAAAEQDEDVVLTVVDHRVRELGQAGPSSRGL